MHNNVRRISVDWGHLLFLVFMVCLIIWYILDARSVSLSFNNLLFIQPVALISLALVAVIIPQCLRRGSTDPQPSPNESAPIVDEVNSETPRIVAITVALGIYAVSINYVGFDVGTFLFALAAMFICGERRPLHLVAYPAILSISVISAFKALIPYPMFTVLL